MQLVPQFLLISIIEDALRLYLFIYINCFERLVAICGILMLQQFCCCTSLTTYYLILNNAPTSFLKTVDKREARESSLFFAFFIPLDGNTGKNRRLKTIIRLFSNSSNYFIRRRGRYLREVIKKLSKKEKHVTGACPFFFCFIGFGICFGWSEGIRTVVRSDF